jgi:hypothetical protein
VLVEAHADNGQEGGSLRVPLQCVPVLGHIVTEHEESVLRAEFDSVLFYVYRLESALTTNDGGTHEAA